MFKKTLVKQCIINNKLTFIIDDKNRYIVLLILSISYFHQIFCAQILHKPKNTKLLSNAMILKSIKIHSVSFF